MPGPGFLVGEDADGLCPPPDLALEPIDWMGGAQRRPVPRREAPLGEEVWLGLVLQAGGLWQLRPDLPAKRPPAAWRRRSVQRRLRRRRRGPAGRSCGQGRARRAGRGRGSVARWRSGFSRGRPSGPMGIQEGELPATWSPAGRACAGIGSPRVLPRRGRCPCRGLAAAVAVGTAGDDRGDRDDPPVLAHRQAGRVDPRIGPVALDRPSEEGGDTLVDLLAQPGTPGSSRSRSCRAPLRDHPRSGSMRRRCRAFLEDCRRGLPPAAPAPESLGRGSPCPASERRGSLMPVRAFQARSRWLSRGKSCSLLFSPEQAPVRAPASSSISRFAAEPGISPRRVGREELLHRPAQGHRLAGRRRSFRFQGRILQRQACRRTVDDHPASAPPRLGT